MKEVCHNVREKWGVSTFLVSDKCALNHHAYALLGVPRHVIIGLGGYVILTHDYDHVFKNIWNNWITESTNELGFSLSSVDYIACWKDVEMLCNKGQLTPIVHLTKLNHP